MKKTPRKAILCGRASVVCAGLLWCVTAVALGACSGSKKDGKGSQGSKGSAGKPAGARVETFTAKRTNTISYAGTKLPLKAIVGVWKAKDRKLIVSLLPYAIDAQGLTQVVNLGGIFAYMDLKNPQPHVEGRPVGADLIFYLKADATSLSLVQLEHVNPCFFWFAAKNASACVTYPRDQLKAADFPVLRGDLKQGGRLELRYRGKFGGEKPYTWDLDFSTTIHLAGSR